jgi:hypothetical protein
MDKKKKILIVSGLLVAVGGYYIYKNMTAKPIVAEEVAPNTLPDTTTPFDINKVLSRGSKGDEVKSLQTGIAYVKVDGDFGEKTEARLKKLTGKTSMSIKEYNDWYAKKYKK